MKLTIALAHPWAGLKAPIPAAAPDLAACDVMVVAVPGEDVPPMTLSLEVANILRDLISTRDKIMNQYLIEDNEEEVVRGTYSMPRCSLSCYRWGKSCSTSCWFGELGSPGALNGFQPWSEKRKLGRQGEGRHIKTQQSLRSIAICCLVK